MVNSDIYGPLSIYLFTLFIELLSVFLVYRQRATAFPSVRASLLGVYIMSILILALEFARLLLPDQSTSNAFSVNFMVFYAASGITLVLLVGLLLTISALAIYLRPKQGGGFSDLFKDLLQRRRETIIFFGYVVYIVFTAIFIDGFRPYSVILENDLPFGGTLLSIKYQSSAIGLLGIVLIFFMVYPSPLFFLSARKIKNDQVKRNLMILPLCYIGVGADLLILQGYLTNTGYTANAIVYLIWGILFAITAVVFSNASTVSSFFDVSPRAGGAPAVGPTKKPFTERLLRTRGLEELGNSLLLEVDPSLKYEDVVRDFAVETMADNTVVFVFTSRGSPVYAALSKIKEVRYYLLSGTVSYVKPTSDPFHMLIPQSDFAIILDAIQKTSELTENAKIGLIFDNLSDMILNSDFDSSYKFLKRQNEVVNDPRVTKLFLLVRGAQDAKQVNLIKSIFPVQLVSDSQGLQRVK